MIDAYQDIIAQWARVRLEPKPMPLFELLDCASDKPELVQHQRYRAALENVLQVFMTIGPDADDTLH